MTDNFKEIGSLFGRDRMPHPIWERHLHKCEKDGRCE